MNLSLVILLALSVVTWAGVPLEFLDTVDELSLAVDDVLDIAGLITNHKKAAPYYVNVQIENSLPWDITSLRIDSSITTKLLHISQDILIGKKGFIAQAGFKDVHGLKEANGTLYLSIDGFDKTFTIKWTYRSMDINRFLTIGGVNAQLSPSGDEQNSVATITCPFGNVQIGARYWTNMIDGAWSVSIELFSLSSKVPDGIYYIGGDGNFTRAWTGFSTKDVVIQQLITESTLTTTPAKKGNTTVTDTYLPFEWTIQNVFDNVYYLSNGGMFLGLNITDPTKLAFEKNTSLQTSRFYWRIKSNETQGLNMYTIQNFNGWYLTDLCNSSLASVIPYASYLPLLDVSCLTFELTQGPLPPGVYEISYTPPGEASVLTVATQSNVSQVVFGLPKSGSQTLYEFKFSLYAGNLYQISSMLYSSSVWAVDDQNNFASQTKTSPVANNQLWEVVSAGGPDHYYITNYGTGLMLLFSRPNRPPVVQKPDEANLQSFYID